jgi:O-antigen ligase
MLRRLGIASRLELAVFVSIVLLVAISPLGREATHPVVIGLTRTLLLTFVVAAVLHANQSPLKICPYFLGLAGLLVAWMALSVLMIPGGHSESAYTFYEDFFFLAAFVLSAHLSRTRSIAWKNALLTTVVVVDVAYLAGAIAIGNKPLTGPFVNPNYFASFLLAGLAVCTACVFFGNSSRIRMWAAAACALFYYGIGQTASRGATLAAMILVALAVFRAARKRRMSLIPVALAFAALGAVTVALNPNLVAKFLDRGQHDPYNYQRVQIWKGTLQMIREHPITGVGLAHFRYRSKQYTPALEGGIGRYGRWPNIAHSEYLQYASEIGIPAAALMFSLIGYLMVLAWRRANTAKDESRMFQEAALLTAAGIGAQALVDNNWSFPVIAGALAVISQADLLPYRDWDWSWTWTPVRRAAFALGVLMVFFHSTVITALGFYFNVAGQSAYKTEDFQRAQTLHRLALAILPRHSVIIDNLGLAYLDDFMKSHRPENLDRAESLFKQALAANPDFDTAGGHLERALIQRLTGDAKRDQPIHAKIIEIDRRILQSNPFNPFIRKNLAEALYNSGNRQEAREQLLKAVELEPNYVPAYLRLSEWSREDGRAQEGDEYRKKAIQVVVHYQEQETLDPFETLLLGRPGINLSRP